MIAAVIKTDLREVWRDGRLPLLLVVSLLLAAVATLTGAQRVSVYERERSLSTQEESRTWNSQGRANPHFIAHFGHYAFKPLTKLASFDPGLSPYLGSMVWMEAHWQDPAVDRTAEDAPEAHRFADLTPAWLLQVIAPLSIMLLGFPLLARERETGLWRSIASVGVSSSRLLIAKTLSLGLLSLIGVSPLIAASFAGPVLSGASMPPDGGLRVAGLVASYGAYLLAFMAVTLAVSAWSSTANMALAVLIGIWTLSVLIVPRLAANIADLVRPLPNAEAFRAEMERDVEQGHGAGAVNARRAAFQASLLKKYGVRNLRDLPLDYAGLELQWAEDFNARILDRHYGNLYATYHRQREPMRWASVISPVLAVREASAFLSGVDEQHHRQFANAAESYRRREIRILTADMINHAAGRGFDYLAGSSLWASVPPFRYAPPTMAQTPGANFVAPAAVIALWLAAGLSLSVVGMRRWSQA